MSKTTKPSAMTREKFIELTGEDPVDVLGEGWEEYSEEYIDEMRCPDCGSLPSTGACYQCKMD